MPLPPLAVLLAGLTGSGKTTLARALSGRGFTRLSVDEEVHRLHGRYGVDYPEDTYFAREAPVLAAVRARFTKELGAGHDVVLDHGLWQRTDRDTWKEAARTAGGLPVLIHLPTTREELLRRLTERNQRADANALAVTPRRSTTSSPATSHPPPTSTRSSTHAMPGHWSHCWNKPGAQATHGRSDRHAPPCPGTCRQPTDGVP